MSEAASNDSGRGRPGRRWRLATRIVLGLILLAVAGFVGLSWYSVSALRGHPGFGGFSTTDTTVISFQLGGCPFAVPLTAENWKHFHVGDHGRIIRMLIKDYTDVPVSAQGGIATRLKIRADFSAPLEARELFDGLEHLVPVGKGRFLSRTELFLERTLAGDLRSLIACSVLGAKLGLDDVLVVAGHDVQDRLARRNHAARGEDLEADDDAGAGCCDVGAPEFVGGGNAPLARSIVWSKRSTSPAVSAPTGTA